MQNTSIKDEKDKLDDENPLIDSIIESDDLEKMGSELTKIIAVDPNDESTYDE